LIALGLSSWCFVIFLMTSKRCDFASANWRAFDWLTVFRAAALLTSGLIGCWLILRYYRTFKVQGFDATILPID